MDRRDFLRLTCAGTAAVGAGCSRLDQITTSPPCLEGVWVRNSDATEHEFRVVVEQHGERVHEATFELGPREPREYGGPYHPAHHLRCEWSGIGPFAVSCTMDGERTARVRLDRWDTEADRYGTVQFTVTETGRLGSMVLFGGTPRECE